MGQKVAFDGKLYTEPVSKARTISGVRNSGAPSSTGNILIIDTGQGANYGGGVGAKNSSGVRELDEMVNTFQGAAEMKNFVKGGLLWDIADYLYAASNQFPSASIVHLIRAATTAPATLTFTTDAADDIELETKEEGVFANGNLSGTKLSTGYAIKVIAGRVDDTKVIFQFYRGSYRGTDADGLLYDGIEESVAADNPVLITESDEVSDISELIAWSETSEEFGQYFKFATGTATSGVLAAADTGSGFTVFSGGTETYDALDDVLAAINELDWTFVLSLDNGSDAAGTENLKILSHILSEAPFKKFMFVGGGDTKATFVSESIDSAQTLNSQYAILCHGGQRIPYSLNPSVEQLKDSRYFAALVAGLSAGLAPQVPLTYKQINMRTQRHQLTQLERVQAIDNGVLHVKNVAEVGLVINQQINTLQRNNYLINNDGTSPEISVERIKAQLNREIQEGAIQFIGGNLFNVTAKDIEGYIKGYLARNTLVAGERDGYIKDSRNVKARRQGTAWFATYEFQANTPINKFFATGTIIEPTAGG